MKPAHKLINSQVNKRDKCLGLTTASSEINQGIITYLSHTGLVLVLWALSYYIVIMCNTSLADMGEHWASKAALNLLLIFNYTDVPFHSLKTLTCILIFFPTLPHTLHVDVLPIWAIEFEDDFMTVTSHFLVQLHKLLAHRLWTLLTEPGKQRA